jgi:selenocysteine lyase/cysteine desulfurase
MMSSNNSESISPATLQQNPSEMQPHQVAAIQELESSIRAALETYSNVHRGSGHFSMVTTHLYEQARTIVLDHMGLDKAKWVLIFLSTPGAIAYKELFDKTEGGSYKMISGSDFGLSIGVSAMAVKKRFLPKGAPLQTGGGTTKMTSKDWIMWADAPDKFEAGTPAIINVIAFAKALLLMKQYGANIYKNAGNQNITADEILYSDELQAFSGHELMNKLRQTLIGRGVLVPTLHGQKPFINLDNSASTPTFEPIWEVFRKTWLLQGSICTEIVEEVKTIIANCMNAPKDVYDIIFTSNTTECINLLAESLSRETEPVILNTLLEHSSNDLPWRMVPGSELKRLSVNPDGFIDMNELENLLDEYNHKAMHGNKRIRLVAVSGASNVLGVCNDMKEISRIVHQYNAMLLVDGAQLAAHRRIDIQDCEIDYLAFSAHKVYAPFGCGALVVRKGLLNFNSEEQKKIQQFSSNNTAGIAALGKALILLQRIGMDLIREEEQVLATRALLGISKINGLKIHGINNPGSKRFAYKVGVIPFNFKNIMPNKTANLLAMQGGIGVRYGCHCAHLIVKRIHNITPFLEQVQRIIQILFPKFRFPGVVRVSFGIENTEADVDTLLQTLENSTTTKDKSHKYSRSEIEKFMEEFVKAASIRVYSQH